jgi:hypothetical protein
VKKAVIALLPVLFLAQGLLADIAGVMFQDIDIGLGARAAGLANAFTAMADDSTAVSWNAAGLANIKRPVFALTYNKWVLDSSIQNISGAYPLNSGAIGINVVYVSMGSFENLDDNGYVSGQKINPYTFGIQAAYGVRVFDYYSDIRQSKPDTSLMLGLGVMYMAQSIGDDSAGAVALNAGMMIDFGQFTAGLALNNFNLFSSQDLPQNIRLGAVRKIDISDLNKLNLAAEIKFPFEGNKKISAGAEYSLADILFLRAGYEWNMDLRTIENGWEGLCGGIGLRFQNVQVDYSAGTLGGLGINNRITLTLRF